MYSISRFQEVLQGLPRAAFQNAVQQHRGDRHCKGFDSWSHLVAMVYAQLAGVSSLRELEAGFNQHHSQHYHLNASALRRSTLAEANGKRNPQIFADTLRVLLQVGGRRLRHARHEMLYLLDSTSIPLRGRGMQWCQASATRTPGLKVHVLYASGQQLPVHQTITPSNINDIEEGRTIPLEAGATYVFDKGYCDYGWWSRIDAAGARFVTRLKTNAAVRVVQARAVPAQGVILQDSLITFAHSSNRGGHRNPYDRPLRRIKVAREAGKTALTLVTNDLQSCAEEIAQLYKQRWQIELFFKWVKQHLSIKRFLGQSENAIRVQLLTALIAYVLVAIQYAGHSTSLWMALAQIRTGLFLRPANEQSRWRRRRQEIAIQTALQPGLFE